MGSIFNIPKAVIRSNRLAICFLIGTLLIGLQSYAQQRPPVQLTTIVGLPNTPFLVDYYSINSNSLKANLLFNDLTEPSIDVYLNINISSTKTKLVSKPNFKPTQRITLNPGQLKTIQGSDFAPYFNFNNLNITGISLSELQRTGMLPEGNYNFCIEVKEYNSGRTVSNLSCAFAVISLQEPPLVLQPKDGAKITPKNPQNITFQWQLRTVPPGGYSNVEYFLTLYEITDPQTKAKSAVANNQALKIYESTVAIQATTLIYDINATLLQAGKRYAFTVQAKDKQNRASFKNDGISEVHWFRYGLSTDGFIDLKKPIDEDGFQLYQAMMFQWSAPDNLEPNMGFVYKLKVVKLDGKSPKDALAKNTPIHTFTSPETKSTADVNYELTAAIEKMEEYAWQVEAEAFNTTIAKSKIHTFSGPPLMPYFIAGNQQIAVIKTYNKDINKLSGKAKIPYGNNEDVIFEFKDIDLRLSGGEYVLEKGEIITGFINQPSPIELTPQIKKNGKAYFQPDSIKLGVQKMYLGGVVNWDLPHAVKGKSKGVVKSKFTYLTYAKKVVSGSAVLDKTNDFELMDPLNFRLELFETKSDFLINSNKFELFFFGNIYVPASVKSKDKKRVPYEFEGKKDLFYFSMARLLTAKNELPLVQNANLYAVPKKVILDLDENKSPNRFSSNKLWKGLYFEDFDVEYYTDVDKSKQLTFDKKVIHTYNLTNDKGVNMWVNPQGLQAKVHRKMASSEDAKFNEFPATLNNINIDVKNSITTASVTGSVLIPFISETSPFDFTIPINDDGFQQGSFDNSLDGYKLTYNPNGGEQVMNVVIKRAVFADNERLDCTIDLDIPKFKVKFKAINNFQIYGDMFIGYGKRNGSYDLPKQKVGKLDQWVINIDRLGAGLIKGNYALSYSGTMPLGNDVSGKTGPPRIDISSIVGVDNTSEGVDLNSGDYSSGKSDIPVTIAKDKPKDQFAFEKMEVKFQSAIVKLDGYIEVRENDPTWGTCFKGGINGSLLVPSKIDMGANMVMGTTQQRMKYWYFDAYFNDTEGTGVPIFNIMSIVALEGRVYRHMKQDMKTKEFVINDKVEFGAGIYAQIIDTQTKGHVVKSDIAAEIEVKKGDFTVQVEGDMAVLNTTARSKSGASAMKKKAATEMAKKAATEAAKQLGEVNVIIPVGSDKLKVRGSASIAGLTYVSGSTEVGFLGEIGSTPKATVFYKNGGDLIDFTGSTSGEAGLTLKKGSDQFKLNFDGSNSGTFNIALSNFSMGASFDKSKSAGSLDLGYDGKQIKLTGNKTNGSGSLFLKYDPKKQFSASLSGSGAGEFTVLYDQFGLYLKGDKSTESGSLGFKLNSDSIYAAIDKSKNEGQLYTDIDGFKIDAYTNSNGGKILVEKGSTKFLLEGNKSQGTGKIELVPSSSEKYSVELEKSGKGNLLVQNSTITLKLGADKTAGSGNFFLNTNGITLKGAADKTAGTGYAGYKKGNDSILVAVPSANEMKLNSSFSGTIVNFNIAKSGEGDAHFKSGGLSLYAGANKTSKTGYFGFKKSNDSLYTKIDATKSEGIFYLALGSKLINANTAAQKGSLLLKDGSKSFKLDADIDNGSGSLELKPSATDLYYLALDKSGTGELKIKKSNFELKLQGDKQAGSGSFYVDASNNIFRGGADKSAKTGYAGYRVGSDSIYANLSSSSFQFNTANGGTYFGLSADKNGKGDLELSKGSDYIKLNGDVAAKSGNFAVSKSGTSVYIAGDLTAKSGSFGFKKGADSVYASLTSSSAQYYLNTQGLLIDVSGNTAGSATLKAANGGRSIEIAGDVTNNTAIIKYAESGLSVELNSSKKEFDFTQGSTKVNVKLGTVVEYYENGTKLSINFSNGQGTFTKTYGSKSVEFTANSNSKYLKVIDGSNYIKVEFDNSYTGSGEFKYGGNLYKAEKDASGNYLVQYNDKKANLKSDKSIELVDGTNRKITLSKDKLTVKYDTYDLGVDGATQKISYKDANREGHISATELYVKDGSKSMKLTSSKTAEFKDGTTKFLKLSADALDVKYDKYTASFNNTKNLNFSDGTRSVAFSSSKIDLTEGSSKLSLNVDQNNPSIELTDGANALKLNKTEATLIAGANTFKFVKGNELQVKYDKYNVSVNKSSASYNDGNYTVALGGTDLLKVSDKTKSFALSNDQKVTFKDGAKTDITVSKDQIDFKYDKYTSSFSKSKALSFSDGTRSFAFSGNTVELNESSKKLKLVTDATNPSIELSDGTNKLKFNKQEAEVIYGQKSLKLTSDAKLVAAHGKHQVSVSKDNASYTDGSLTAAIGGGKIISIKDGTRSLELDKTSFAVKDGKYAATIGSNKTFSATDGTQTITMGGQDLIKYSKSNMSLALYKGSIGYGVKSTYDGYTIGVEAGKGKSALVSAEHSSMGKLSFRGTSGGDLTVGYEKGSDDLFVDAGKKSFKVYGTYKDKILKSVTGGGPAKDAKYIGGSAPPSMSGPQYLGPKISMGEGYIKGKASLYYSSGKDHLLINAAVSGKKPVCINGALLVESKKGNFKVMIGEKTKYISIFPTCSGFGGEGYFYFDPNKVEFYAQGGFRFNQYVGIGVVGIRAKAHLLMGFGAAAELSPFKILSAEIAATMGASLSVEYDFFLFSGSFEVASASLNGRLKANFETNKLTGNLNGRISVIGIGTSFRYDLDASL